MLTSSVLFAKLLLITGILAGAWCYRNIWRPPPQLTGKYGNEYVVVLWIGFGVAAVMLVYGVSSLIAYAL